MRAPPPVMNGPMRAVLLATALAFVLHAARAQGGPGIPGLPPDEYVDVTGDGMPDLLITGTHHFVDDPQQPGFQGLYTLGVRTMHGTSVLQWSTPSNQRWSTLDSTTRLDTAELAARIHFKQLTWTDASKPLDFPLLERPYGPGITAAADGWYGTGDHHDGHTLVLRSVSPHGTCIAAFTFELPYPLGRVVVRTKEVVRVLNGYGREGDPVPQRPSAEPSLGFGHEEPLQQVMVPPGLAPDEPVDLNGDAVNDLVVRSIDQQGHGTGDPSYTVRGIAPLPGTAFLFTNVRWGVWGPYYLLADEALTPQQLDAGLRGGSLRWVTSAENAFIELLRHPHGMEGVPDEWSAVHLAGDNTLVYRTTSYGRVYVGALEVDHMLPGGQLGVRPQAWVEEGHVLQVR